MADAEPSREAPATRTPLSARLRVAATGAAVALADVAPPGVRYGYLHPVAARLLRRPLAAVPAVDGVRFAPPSVAGGAASDMRCGLLADHLDVGGVGRVVEMLAEGLGAAGIEPVVVCPGEGTRTTHLRELGVEVVVADDPSSARGAVAEARLDAIQLHSAPRFLVAAAAATGLPLVPVLHNTEIHYNGPMWRDTAELFRRSAAVVAVSDVVRRFHERRIPSVAAGKIVVVANGSMPVPRATDEARVRARAALAEAIACDLGGETVVVCLARYDSQKNIAGTVSAFLSAPVAERQLRLVVAGEPSDWLEYVRADAIRRAHRHGDRVHLLGNSDAATTLVAGDAFVLDSFFEGWPLAATEAVAVGVPVVLSDAGGAAELVARAPRGSALVANAAGPADRVDDRRVRAARRRARHQPNAPAVASALVAAADAVRAGRPSRPLADDSFAEMIAGHAAVVRAAAGRRGASRAGGTVPAAEG